MHRLESCLQRGVSGEVFDNGNISNIIVYAMPKVVWNVISLASNNNAGHYCIKQVGHVFLDLKTI
jgi:hypothetical protein